jgi:hypothetical protein
MRKVTLLVGFGAGYVLGAKAGRARYEQIKRQFEGWMGKPAVQDTLQTVKHEAGSVLDKAKTTVTDKVGGTDTTPPTVTVGAGTMADSSAGRGGTGRLDPYPS